MPLFDPNVVPAHVVSAEGVRSVNAVVEAFRGRLIDKIEMQEAPSRYRGANVIRAYNQAQIRRVLIFLDAAWDEVRKGRGLVALTCIRAVYETVATFLGFEIALEKLILAGDLEEVHQFMKNKTYATRLDHLIDMTEDKATKATSALTMIDKMVRIRPSVRDEYDHLCEYAHPNVFGSYLYFARDNANADVTTFTSDSPEPEDDMKMVLLGAHLMEHMLEALKRIDGHLQTLSALAAAQAPIQL